MDFKRFEPSQGKGGGMTLGYDTAAVASGHA
jgi:hypothetical protein